MKRIEWPDKVLWLAFALIALGLFLTSNADASSRYFGTCTKVTDGDTIFINSDTIIKGENIKIRLRWIDSPEMSQSYGVESQKYLEDLILSKDVFAICGSKDRYKRSVCVITLDGLNINQELVKTGHAWSYKGYSTKAVAKLQTEAQSNNVGMWETLDPTCQPSQFRKKLCK